MEPDQDNHSVTAENKAKYSLPVDDVTERFRSAGFPFSDRTASRWCQKKRLDCILMPVESGRIEKYFATPVSVDAEIAKMHRFKNAAMARHDATRQDMARHGTPTSKEFPDEQEKVYEQEIEKLQQQSLNLRIDNKAKEQVINHLTQDRKDFIEQLTQQSHTIGKLETQLLALQAPRTTEERGGGDKPPKPVTDVGYNDREGEGG